MKKAILGKTGLSIAPFGFGALPMQRISHEESKELLLFALEQGINFIDTARAYTDSEEKIGFALPSLPEKPILATKTLSRTYDEMKADIEISLKNLKTSYIDLYQIHNPRTMEQAEMILSENGALRALIEAKNDGKIGHIGITGHTEEILLYLLKNDNGAFETIQFPYNLIETQAENELIPYARERNLGLIAMKPLAGGAITPKIALSFLHNNPFDVIIPGMTTKEELLENLTAFKSPLTSEQLHEAEKIKKDLGQSFCRRCDYCKPCPAQIDINSIFLMHGYFLRYDLKDWSIARYNSLEANGADCKECGICESRCPYNLPIRELLKKADADLSRS